MTRTDIEFERPDLTPDVLTEVERTLVIQRRAVVLLGPEVTDSAAMTSLTRAVRRRCSWAHVLESKPAREDDWLDAMIAAGSGNFGVAFFTPLGLAYRNKYGGECEFHRPQADPLGGTSRPGLLVNLDGITRNPDSHAWTYFAPEFRRANVILAFGRLDQLPKLRPLIELIHPLDDCVVWAEGYPSLRLKA